MYLVVYVLKKAHFYDLNAGHVVGCNNSREQKRIEESNYLYDQ
jgi:hypothetical protein